MRTPLWSHPSLRQGQLLSAQNLWGPAFPCCARSWLQSETDAVVQWFQVQTWEAEFKSRPCYFLAVWQLNLSVVQFPHLYSRGNNSTYPLNCMRSEWVNLKHLVLCSQILYTLCPATAPPVTSVSFSKARADTCGISRALGIGLQEQIVFGETLLSFSHIMTFSFVSTLQKNIYLVSKDTHARTCTHTCTPVCISVWNNTFI